MKYTPLYSNKPFEEIKQKLYKEIQSALHKKYGANPDPLVLKRVKEEWNFLCKYHSIEDAWKDSPEQQAIVSFAFIHDIGRWLRHNNYPYWNRGTGASSFILYLLDVTFVNPLPAHYHCPHCHQIYWKHNEYKDGFDLPQTAKCKHDNTPLIADGHNIPWQSLLKYPTHAFHFDIDTTENAKEHVLLFGEQNWLNKLNPNINLTIPHPHARPSIIWYDSLTIDCHIKGTYQDFFTTHIDNSCRKIALRAWKDILNLNIYGGTPELPEPCTFADLVYNLGLNCSTGVWNEDSNILIERFGYSPSDLIAFRDDVFNYFVEHHISESKAYVMSDQVRRGFIFHDFPKHLNIAKDKWILKHIRNIEYLFPKAHALEWIFFALKTKVKAEQKRYEKPYIAKNINISVPYNLGNLPITKTDFQELSQKEQQMVEVFNNILKKYYRNTHMNLPMPDIIISTEAPEESYGKIPLDMITYDFYEILSKYNVLIDEVKIPAFPQAFSMLDAILEKVKAKSYRQTLLKDIENFTKYLDTLNDPGPYSDKCDICKAISSLLHDLYGLSSALLDLEETIPTLAKYDYKQNNILLYIENIYQHFKQASGTNNGDKLKAGLETSLAHAICNAITFYFAAETQSLREKFFDDELDAYDCKEFLSKSKALGRWFEYVWCKQNITKYDVYQWRINQIKDEALNFSPKHWPYAESKNILLTDDGDFLENKYINGKAINTLKNFSKRKDALYWDEVDYQ